MTYAERLRALDKAGAIRLHERVLSNGEHHVWLTAGPGAGLCRVDRSHRDFETACQFALMVLMFKAPWLFETKDR